MSKAKRQERKAKRVEKRAENRQKKAVKKLEKAKKAEAQGKTKKAARLKKAAVRVVEKGTTFGRIGRGAVKVAKKAVMIIPAVAIVNAVAQLKKNMPLIDSELRKNGQDPSKVKFMKKLKLFYDLHKAGKIKEQTLDPEFYGVNGEDDKKGVAPIVAGIISLIVKVIGSLIGKKKAEGKTAEQIEEEIDNDEYDESDIPDTDVNIEVDESGKSSFETADAESGTNAGFNFDIKYIAIIGIVLIGLYVAFRK